MAQYRLKSKVVTYFGAVLIREKVQVRKRYFWHTIERRHFGPYPSYLAAHLAIAQRGGEVITI